MRMLSLHRNMLQTVGEMEEKVRACESSAEMRGMAQLSAEIASSKQELNTLNMKVCGCEVWV